MYLALVGKSEAVATPFPLPRGGAIPPIYRCARFGHRAVPPVVPLAESYLF